MANQVYANGMEIACKAASGKSIAAFPDTCLSPPTPPAGPLPIPYPNTANASDTTNGTTTVMISNKEVMMKDQSTFKKSTGDEAATKSQGMGVVTHTIQGEASFVAWSMNVKFEGANVPRHLDMTLHNEQSQPDNTPPMPYIDEMSPPDGGTPEHKIKCAIKKCDEQKYDVSTTKAGKAMPPRSRCAALGSKKHKCVQEKLKGLESDGIYPEKPCPAGCVPGLAKNVRPDVMVFPNGGKPFDQPCQIFDAIFPCSDKVKTGNSLFGVLPSAPISAGATGKVASTAKESTHYQVLAGKGDVMPLSPKDCEGETCP